MKRLFKNKFIWCLYHVTMLSALQSFQRERKGGLVGAWLVGCWVGALLGVGMFPMGPVVEEPRAASAGGVSFTLSQILYFTIWRGEFYLNITSLQSKG